MFLFIKLYITVSFGDLIKILYIQSKLPLAEFGNFTFNCIAWPVIAFCTVNNLLFSRGVILSETWDLVKLRQP